MKPAAAAPSAARTNRAPELTSICSLSIISRTAPAKAPPLPSVRSVPPGIAPETGAAVSRRIINGIRSSPQNGAMAMPTAIGAAP